MIFCIIYNYIKYFNPKEKERRGSRKSEQGGSKEPQKTKTKGTKRKKQKT